MTLCYYKLQSGKEFKIDQLLIVVVLSGEIVVAMILLPKTIGYLYPKGLYHVNCHGCPQVYVNSRKLVMLSSLCFSI